jgi:hypothetical protein
MDNWSSLPFNGQARRISVISEFSRSLKVGVVIETGTYLGSSTPYLASLFNCKTYTLEIDPYFANRAVQRFEQNHPGLEIELVLGDSAEQISRVLSSIPLEILVFAYLDAHWLDKIPTSEEIQALLEWGGSWVAVIDDFKIAHDPNYKFDSYGQVEIGIGIIPDNEFLEVWVPGENAILESGNKSGTAYVFSNAEVRSQIPQKQMKQLLRIL